MKIRIVIQDYEIAKGQTLMEATARQSHVNVWEGDIEILKDNVYITKISILAEGEPQPICDIPFSMNKGYYLWIPPEHSDLDSENPEQYFLVPGQVINADVVSAYPPELTERITLENTANLREDPGED